MNSHFASQFSCSCVANLPNSLLLRAIRRLESEELRYKLFRPELIKDSLGFYIVAFEQVTNQIGINNILCMVNNKHPVSLMH